MSLPIVQQANAWVGYFFCYIAIAAIYYSNTWNVIVTILLTDGIDVTYFFSPPVEILPHALYIPLLFQRFYLPPSSSLHRAQFSIESNRS